MNIFVCNSRNVCTVGKDLFHSELEARRPSSSGDEQSIIGSPFAVRGFRT
jgi:hypothetical protein